jgi:hypothetical protein
MTDKFPKPVSAPSVPKAFDGEIYQAVGKYARSAVLFAFEQNGGAEGLANWAVENKDEFYTKLFPKIIARESEVTHHRSVDQLMDVIDGDYTVEGEVIDEGDVWNTGADEECQSKASFAMQEDRQPTSAIDGEEDDFVHLEGTDLVEFEE